MRNIKKVFSKVFFTTSALAISLALPMSFVSNSKTNLITKQNGELNSTKISGSVRENQYKGPVSTTNLKVNILQNQTAIQNTAYGLDNEGFATFTYGDSTSSSGQPSSPSNGETTSKKANQITKFLTTNFYSPLSSENNGSQSKAETNVKYAGSVDWVVTTKELAQEINTKNGVGNGGTSGSSTSGVSENDITLESILYSVGGAGAFKSIFVIASVNQSSTSGTSLNGTYLFQIQWEDQKIGSISHKGGEYRLAATLSKNTTSSTNNKYNQLALENPSTHTMQALQVDSVNNSSSQQTIKYVTVSNTDFEAGSDLSTNGSDRVKSLTFTPTSNNFNTSETYKPIYVNRINSNIFVVYQSDTSLGDKSIVLMKSPTIASAGATVNITNFLNVDLSQLNGSSKPTKNTSNLKTVTIYNNDINNPQFDFLFSTKNTKYSHYSLDFVNFKQITTGADATTSGSGTIFDNNTYGAAIKQLTPVYANNSTSISGYLGLTDNNKVLKLNSSFKITSILYDFNTSTFNLGNIYFIYTKFGSNNWYAQMSDGTFAEFYENTLIGQWDKLSSKDSNELPVRFTIKSQNEVSPTVLYQKVANDTGTEYDVGFLQFLESDNAYEYFLNVDPNSIDPRLNGALPDINVKIKGYIENPSNGQTNKPTADGENSKNYKVTLEFAQTLRKISPSGEISPDQGTTITLASQEYLFTNTMATIEAQTDKNASDFSIPAYVLDMFPTQIVEILKNSQSANAPDQNKNFLEYFIKTKNVSGATYTFSGNDLDGSLTINLLIPLVWISESGKQEDAVLRTNYTTSFDFKGINDEHFFNYNPFGKNSKGEYNDSVTPIDEAFALKPENQDIMNTLKANFSSKLPSSLTKQDFYKNFLVLGSAFSNKQYIDSNLITLPTDENIQIVPNDNDGSAFVDITFPYIGPKKDYRVIFQTPSIFAKNLAASQTVYFSWKTKDSLDLSSIAQSGLPTSPNVDNTSSIGSYKASDVAALINSAANGTDNYESLMQILNVFCNFSSYYANLMQKGLIKVNATYNDKYGVLNINLAIDENIEIPGINSSNISTSYVGFKVDENGSGDLNLDTTNFTFGTYTGNKNVSPSSIIESDLIAGNLLPKNWETLKQQNNARLELIPSNSTGILQVGVTIANVVTSNTVLPSKTFITTITGLKVTTQPNNLISWKTNSDFGTDKNPAQVKSAILSAVGSELASDYNYKLLKQLAFISDELQTKLDNNPSLVTNVTMLENNVNGTLAASATIKIEGASTVFQTVITGLKGTAYDFNIEFNVSGDGEGNANLTKLRASLPSTIRAEDPNLLALFKMEASDNLVKEIDLVSDDFTGVLTINLRIKDPQTNNILVQDSRTFNGFVKQSYTDKGTNWGIVAACLVVPLVVLIIPIFSIGIFQNRRDMKKIAKRLSKRLTDEQDKQKRKLKLAQMKDKY